ncbi:YetF domain-containing protein [uncultured Fibrella sp.]|uniref:YetF domain-containing protein n=1 Tax=uncultured Fibrella sp. TaxID=1284596 RepID=UPI0035CAD7E8
MKDPVSPFDWQRIWLHEYPVTYLGEVAFRTFFMFIVILAALTVSGKREVRQLSVYELVLLIGLGSAAGDPMFYHDVPLGAAVVVFIVIMVCYKFITRLSDRNRTIREKLEGIPVYVIENGCILTQNFNDEDLGKDELFVDLRQAGIEQLGEVRVAILEPNGQLSLYKQPDEAVRPGLPILPKALAKFTKHIVVSGTYACTHCGNTQPMQPDKDPICPNCHKQAWVLAQR